MGLPIKSELAREEAIIERGLKSFIEVGNALMRIRDNDLYTVTHDTFEAYCKERWGFTRVRAHQLIDAAKKGSHPDLLRNLNKLKASHFEPLAGKSSDESAKILLEANEIAGDGPITEKLVQEVVNQKDKIELNDVLMAHHYASFAINQLKKIDKKDPSRRKEGYRVIRWITTHLTGGKYHE